MLVLDEPCIHITIHSKTRVKIDIDDDYTSKIDLFFKKPRCKKVFFLKKKKAEVGGLISS